MSSETLHRSIMLAFGAASGLAFYLLFEWLPDVLTHQPSFLVIVTWTLVFAIATLANSGPISVVRSALGAAGLALGMSLLMLSVYTRFSDLDAMFDTGHPIFAAGLLGFVAIPFVAAVMTRPNGWQDYELLFDLSWGAVTRTIAAGAFTGLFWALLVLSDALLELVGLTIIEDIIDIDGAPWLMSGAVMGIALAVVYELEDYISPNLILRMLRLFLPMVLLVVAVFLIALPLRGLSDLFGQLSAGAIMMGIAVVAAGLVTTVLGRTSEDGVQMPAMLVMTQSMAVLGACVGGLAVYAVWIRVADYGWTPERLVAMTIACITAIYGLSYAVIVVLRRNWGARIRHANIWLALGLVGVVAAWMTPLLNPQNISTKSQIARYENGDALGDLPLFEMSKDWGRTGRAGLDRLEALVAQADSASDLGLIAKARTAQSKYAIDRVSQTKDLRRELAAATLVLPEGAFPSETLYT